MSEVKTKQQRAEAQRQNTYEDLHGQARAQPGGDRNDPRGLDTAQQADT